MSNGISAGLEVKVGPLELVLGKVEESLSHLDKSIRDFTRDTPFFHRTLAGSGSIGGAGSFLVPLNGPSGYPHPGQGKLWCVTRICLFGTAGDYSPVANLTGATAYIGPTSEAPQSSLVLVPLLGSTTVPGIQTFGDDTVYQYPEEDLFINVVVSAASGAFATATVKEYAIDDIQPRVI
jgi:hypothetical protein